MSELGERLFEVATDGSDRAQLMCEKFLQPLANEIVGGDFKTSDVDSVGREHHLGYNDMSVIGIDFNARYCQESDPDEIEVQEGTLYDISITFKRGWEEGEFWPSFDEADEADDTGDSEDQSDLRLLDEDDDDENDEDFPHVELRAVQEVWQFQIDDIAYRTRRNVSFQYHYDGQLVGVEKAALSLKDGEVLSDDMDEDADLSIKDACFAHVFSEQDIKIIEAVCRFDFDGLLKLLCQRDQWSI